MMRRSAGLVLLGLVLLGVQVGFSDGAVPLIVSLPIGIWPLAGGMVTLIAGLLAGLVSGTMRYRLAALMGLLGTMLAGFGLLFVYSRVGSVPAPAFTVNDIALALAAVLWVATIAIGIDELRRAPGRGASRAR